MAVSQNGWTIDQSGAKQTRTGVDGVTFPNGVLAGDVATVLLYVAGRFHREVEPLKKGSCWGWYVKPIEGSSVVSNHASGTAIDLNADTHPMGVRGTFTAPKKAKLRAILNDCGGVVRWGGDYTGRADEMHFEINRDAATVKALAAKIRDEDPMSAITIADIAAAAEQGFRNALASGYLAKDQAGRNIRDQLRGIVGGPADAALAAAIAEQVLAALPEGALTADDVETAVRNVLRTGVDS